MRVGMSDFTEDQLDAIWKKAKVVEGLDAEKFRLDAADALMARDKYGEEGYMFAWQVDHIYPKARLKKLGVKEELWDDLRNLRPMNAKNNESKGDDYPDYKASYEYDRDQGENKEVESHWTIKASVQDGLAALFGLKDVKS